MRGIFKSVTIARKVAPSCRIRHASTAEGASITDSPGIFENAISSMAALFSESSTIRTTCAHPFPPSTGMPLFSRIRRVRVLTVREFSVKLGDKPITYTVDGEEVTWSIRIRFQLLPEFHHMCIHGPGIREKLISPDR